MKLRLGALDGLRGIAIALVLWFHVWQITWLRADVPFTGGRLNFNLIPEPGFLGVDLFFFISGFCLFLPYAEARLRGEPAPALAHFFYNRALKIVPSYVLAIFAMTALGLAHFGSMGEAFREIALHLLFIHIWFPGSYGSINGVLWSLGVEVQFYIIFPALAWCALRAPIATFATVALVANAYRFGVRDAYDATHLINQLPGALDLFGAGMLVAYAYGTIARKAPQLAGRRMFWTLVSCVGALLCYVIFKGAFDARLLPDWPYRWLAVGRPLISLALPLLTLGALFALPAWQRVLVNPPLVFLSLISYNLYLWHSAVAHALLDARFPMWHGAEPHDDAAWPLMFTAVAFAASIGVATVLTYGFERPLLRARPFAPDPSRKTSLAHTYETPLSLTE